MSRSIGVHKAEVLEEILNTNSLGAFSSPLEMEGMVYVGMYVCGDSGSHSSHVVTLQVSPNGTDWFDTNDTVTGTGFVKQDLIVATEIRAKVTTAEGATSTCKVYLIVE